MWESIDPLEAMHKSVISPVGGKDWDQAYPLGFTLHLEILVQNPEVDISSQTPTLAVKTRMRISVPDRG